MHLRAQRGALEKLWQQGLSGQALLAEQSRLVDVFIRQHFQNATSELTCSIALVALGGYGRQELFPYSDIDLLILYQPEQQAEIKQVAEAILYPLWDAGLEVGHAVRTIEESMEHAGQEFFFQVAMLDARFLAGSQELFDDLLVRYRLRFIEGGRDEFVRSMKAFRAVRRKRFGSHSYLLEPHIKEGKGGMRDIQAMLWTAKVVFGLDSLQNIVEAGVLLEEEREAFSGSWNELVKIRNRLHYISGRKNDQLYFEHQEELARVFGYKTGTGILPVENFMRETHGHLQTIAVITDLFFEHVDEVFALAVKGERSVRDRILEKGIELRNNRLHLLVSPGELAARPYLLMRLFLASASTGTPVHHRTRKIVSASLGLIDDKMLVSPRMSRPFFELLLHPATPLSVLEVMLETGLLAAYIPELERISTLVQHDIYHIYTVDRHLLQTVAELRLIVEQDATVYLSVSSPHILYLAALLHDIGKGSGGNHSLIGAEMVGAVGARLGLEPAERDCLAFLVRNHLFMPDNALRRDLNDESFIRRCSETIGDSDRLAMLYLLSIADSRATGPSAWSEWKGALLQEMFLKISPYLEPGQIVAVHPDAVRQQVEQGADWLRRQVVLLLDAYADEEGQDAAAASPDGVAGPSLAVTDVGRLPADYLLSFTPGVVARHIRICRQNYQILQKKALIFPRELGQHWSLLIVARDRSGLLAKICGVLALHNLSVLSAQIFTWEGGEALTARDGLNPREPGVQAMDGSVSIAPEREKERPALAVDVLEVRPLDGLSFLEMDWQAVNDELDRALNHRLGLEHWIFQKLASIQERRKLPEAMLLGQQSRVVIDNDISDRYTVIEVHSADRAGQLYHITQTLAGFGVNIYRAFIATEIHQLIDIFYVLDSKGRKITDESFASEIREGLLYAIGRAL
ncbi:MAG: [protein-PII] uridylyltransferase [Desulfoarculaceae bacterium]|nr:[protein-PII] uridylyltransferase [Desulfoarculaceae bacterium]